jgi:hypothetical protein
MNLMIFEIFEILMILTILMILMILTSLMALMISTGTIAATLMSQSGMNRYQPTLWVWKEVCPSAISAVKLVLEAWDQMTSHLGGIVVLGSCLFLVTNVSFCVVSFSTKNFFEVTDAFQREYDVTMWSQGEEIVTTLDQMR